MLAAGTINGPGPLALPSTRSLGSVFSGYLVDFIWRTDPERVCGRTELSDLAVTEKADLLRAGNSDGPGVVRSWPVVGLPEEAHQALLL